MYLEVWTDGTISPMDAISHSAELLVEQLSPFVTLAQASKTEVEKKAVTATIPDEKYNMPVEELDLSVRTMNSLRRGGITTVGELVSKGEKELLSLRNFGQKSRQEVEERLKSLGLSLAIDISKIKDEGPSDEEEESDSEADDSKD
jgi:DNA-directed RNA polymerase subunit alpha